MVTAGLDSNSLRRWAVAGPLIVALVAAAMVAFARPETGEVLGVLGIASGSLTAGVLIIRRSRRLDRREQTAWRFAAIGLFLVATGVLLTGVLTELGFVVSAYGPIDLFFLGGYTMFLVTLYRLARSDTEGRDWILTILDAVVGAIALAVLVWTVFYNELIETLSRAPAWERVVAGIYPLLDVAAIIGLMILVIRRSHFRWDPRLVFLAVGLSIQVAADLTYLQRGLGQSFVEAEPLFGLFLLATAGYLTAAALIDRAPKKREFPDRDAPVFALVWPYMLAGVLLGTHVVRYHSTGQSGDGVLLLDALLVIGAVVFLRQIWIIHHHRIRVENQRSELIASVSHELRTPLTAMVGYLDLLDENSDEFPAEARQEMVAEAANQARHMARLVTDLVVLARGNHQGLPLVISELALESIIADALRGVDPAETRIEVDSDENARVQVDADRVRQALANLLTNAVRYGADRALLSGRVKGRDLVFEVHDNGKGVPTRHEAAVWQRFERGAHRLNAVTPGMGIGLAIVRAVAEAHGGSAGYRRSDVLGGACFWLSIPECVVGAEAPTPANA